jgi:hypothetical protein
MTLREIGPSFQRCQAGHTWHESQLVHVRLLGQPAVPDFPPIPHELACAWEMLVWDTGCYMGQAGIYCTGQDETSLSIASQGIWEGYETLAALEILHSGSGMVVDIGAQVGWYTMLAAVSGHPVVAVEADPENVRLLRLNAGDLDVEVIHGWLGPASPPVETGHVRLLKADIEGLEREAVRVFSPMLAARRVDWLLLELTPSFPGSDVAGVVRSLHEFGYGTWLVPEKGTEVGGSLLRVCQTLPVTPDEAAGMSGQRTLLAGVA